MNKVKTVTICGSRRFMDEILKAKMDFERMFYIVHTPNFSFTKDDLEEFTDEQLDMLHEVHYTKMRNSDFVYIVNVDGYIGSDTMREVDYAKEHNMEIRYLVEVV